MELDNEYLCKIPISNTPFVGETGTGKIVVPYVHANRKEDFNVMIYILQGEMEVIEDGIAYSLTPRTLFFLKNGVQHWGKKNFKLGTSWCYAHFYTDPILKDMTPFHDRSFLDEDIGLLPNKINDYLPIPKLILLTLGDSLEKKITTLSKLQGMDHLIKRNILMWEILLESYQRSYGSKTKSKEEILVQSIIDYLEKNFNQKFSMEDLEQDIGLSYKYIGSLFKKNTSLTIKSYQLMLRLRESVILLGETQLTISEIADAVGFGDVYYFSNVFKREKGITPSRFRKEYEPHI